MKFLVSPVLGLALIAGVGVPASAATAATPSHDSCPLLAPESPLLRTIDSLELNILTMLGLTRGGCSD